VFTSNETVMLVLLVEAIDLLCLKEMAVSEFGFNTVLVEPLVLGEDNGGGTWTQ